MTGTPRAGRGGFTVVWIRHGRTLWNAQRRFLGRTDVPLDEVGLEEVARLGAREFPWRFDRIYSSPLSRALQTARMLDGRVAILPDLRELDQGDLEGLRAEDALRRYPAFFRAWGADPTHAPVPGGESLGACQRRGLSALERVYVHASGRGAVAMVSHQMVIASVVCGVLGRPLASWRDHRLPNAGVTVLARRGDAWSLVWERWLPSATGLVDR